MENEVDPHRIPMKMSAWDAMQMNPNAFFYRNLMPSEEPKHGPWTNDEKKLFIQKISLLPADFSQWGLFSIQIPGRNGYQCQTFYHRLCEIGEVGGELLVSKSSNEEKSILHTIDQKIKVHVQYPNDIPVFGKIAKRNHRHYIYEDIFHVLMYLTIEIIPYGAISKISRDTGIPTQTLSDWRRNCLIHKSAEWFEVSHSYNRALSDEIENSIFSFIDENLISTGIGAIRQDIKMLTLNAYSSLDIDEEKENYFHDRFCASEKYIDKFMERYKISLQTPHLSRRSKIDAEYEQTFLSRMHVLLDEYQPNRIYNADETSWRLVCLPEKVLSPIGSGEAKLSTNANVKACVTAVFVINAAGESFPIWVLEKGKTERCVRKYGDISDVVFCHTTNGWVKEEITIRLLEEIRNHAGDDAACLILDVYSAHRTESVLKRAKKLKIELIFIPAGGTGKYQPLDYRLLGEMKSRAKRLFMLLASKNCDRNITHHQSILLLKEAWKSISTENIRKSWRCILPNLLDTE